MAYRDTVSGDNGYLGSVELRHTLPPVGEVNHAVSALFNAGRIDLHDASYTITDGVSLRDVGVAYNLSWRSLFLRGQVARTVGGWPASLNRDDRTRFLLQAGVMF